MSEIHAPGMSPSDERTWAMLSHVSVLLNIVTGLLGTVAALVIYLAFRDRSRYVAYQALQALLFQLFWWLGGGIIVGAAWTVTGVLSIVLVGLLCVPFALILSAVPIVALVYGVLAAIQCYQGTDFRYWLIGDWVRSAYTG